MDPSSWAELRTVLRELESEAYNAGLAHCDAHEHCNTDCVTCMRIHAGEAYDVIRSLESVLRHVRWNLEDEDEKQRRLEGGTP